MISLHRVGRINDAPYISSVLEITAQVVPFVTPGLDNNRIFISPFLLKIVKFRLCLLLCGCTINEPEILQKFLLMLAADISHRVANLMDDAELHIRLWKHALDGIRKSCKTVNTGYKDVLYSAVL